MKKITKRILSLCLALAMILGLAGIPNLAQAAPEPATGKTAKITLRWNQYGHKGAYVNPADMGKEVSFTYYIWFNGTDKDGNLIKDLYHPMTYQGKIGEDQVFNLPIDTLEGSNDRVKKQSFSNIKIQGLDFNPYSGNTIYSRTTQYDYKKDEYTIIFSQQMNLKTAAKIEEDGIFLDKDKGRMPVRYTVEQKYNGETNYPYTGKRSYPIACTMPFPRQDTEIELWRGWEFYRAFDGSDFDLFNPYTGKYKEYRLVAEFDGPNKDHLNDCYELKMTGNDLDGWTVTLSSKIQEEVRTETQEIDYQILYEDDPTLLAGQFKVKQEGIPGEQKLSKTVRYIIKDGQKVDVETIPGETTIIRQPVDKIYLRGTKKLGSDTTPTPQEPKDQNRIGGEDRIETATKISSKYYDRADTVLLARRDDFPDALTASVLAKALNAPILLTDSKTLDSRTASEIKRLGASKVLLIGGESALSLKVAEAAKALAGKVERIGGTNRYETAALVAKRGVALTGQTNQAVIATGEQFADALAISSYAAQEGTPILLTQAKKLPAETAKAVQELGMKSVIIAGGETAVSKAVEQALPRLSARVGGADRYETAALIAERYFAQANQAFLASGERFADALVIGPVAGRLHAPVLLTAPKALPSVIKKHIKKAAYEKITIVGLEQAISAAVEAELK